MSELHELDFVRAGDQELFEAIQSFVGASLPPAQRQSEGYTVDFKQEWGDKSLRVVAGFANTFGGIIVVGVTEVGGRASDVIGIPASRVELKTKIASSIASNISPTPDFEIAVCTLPTDSSRQVAVIRVRARPRIHYFLKGEHPVYVRNADEARPAPAAELRALVEREHAVQSPSGLVMDNSLAFANMLTVTRISDSRQIPGKPVGRIAAESYMRMTLVPERQLTLNLDYRYEERFKQLIAKFFAKFVGAVTLNADAENETRGADTYVYKITRAQPDIETVWALLDSGALGFAASITLPFITTRSWSLPDVAANVGSMVRLANDVLGGDGYWGEVRASLEISPNGTGIYCEGTALSSFVRTDFYPEGWPHKIFPQFDPKPTTWHGTTSQLMNYESRSSGMGLAVARMLNQVLRGLGYSADFDALRKAVESATR